MWAFLHKEPQERSRVTGPCDSPWKLWARAGWWGEDTSVSVSFISGGDSRGGSWQLADTALVLSTHFGFSPTHRGEGHTLSILSPGSQLACWLSGSSCKEHARMVLWPPDESHGHSEPVSSLISQGWAQSCQKLLCSMLSPLQPVGLKTHQLAIQALFCSGSSILGMNQSYSRVFCV